MQALLFIHENIHAGLQFISSLLRGGLWTNHFCFTSIAEVLALVFRKHTDRHGYSSTSRQNSV